MTPKAIREKLAEIGRYQSSISPKLQKYKDLEQEKEVLRKLLRESGDKQSGTNPEPVVKKKSKMPYLKRFYK